MARRISQLLSEARVRLRKAPHAPPAREAHLLLGHCLGWGEAQVLARDDRTVDSEQAERFLDLVERRLQGEPVAYLTGKREFYGRVFQVDSRVLIPRPETEHLVAAVLELDTPAHPRLLDIGVGSGCLAVTLALELEAVQVIATDRSLGALAVARSNAAQLGANQVRTICTDWLDGIELETLDLVVSNPPYVAVADREAMSPEILDYEPESALFSGEAGIDSYREIFSALRPLRTGTPVLVEVGMGQGDAVISLAAESGFEHLHSRDDYAGIRRVVVVNRA